MPRPRKCRKVCSMPVATVFTANGENDEHIALTVDEYECIRLVDHQGFSQEQCAEYMQVSRATVQLICESARKKLAAALVKGCSIHIEGGDYRICDGKEEFCSCGGCRKHGRTKPEIKEKGENTMRIAVTYENDMIFQHFGHTQQFKIYDVQDGRIVSVSVAGTNGQGHGALAMILSQLQADVLICGGIGGGAQMALAQAGIKLYGGVSGSCDDAVEAFLAGKLDYDPEVKCDHHGHDHNCGEHGCGEHNCGEHNCGEHN